MAKPKVDPQGIRFLCGVKPGSKMRVALTEADLTKHERKVLKNFTQFLQGKGSRCTLCLHKAVKHDVRCGARGCDCPLSNSDVKATRAQAKVQGWEED